MIKVQVNKPRPDFRVFGDLLFGIDNDVDTEGDAYPVYSRDWRDLFLKDRKSDNPKVEIYSEESSPLLFKIESKSTKLRELAALYLYMYCGDSISIDGVELSDQIIKDLLKKYPKELKRANESVWHGSSEENPYPNIA